MKELIKMLGKTVLYISGEMRFKVKIFDVRQMFGRTDYHIEPVAGNGCQWVSSEKIKSDPDCPVVLGGKETASHATKAQP